MHVPPAEYDPVTYEPLAEMVPVSGVGTVVSWTWQPEPLAGQPLDRPFAWALIKLDGADTPLLHAVDAGEPEAITPASGCTCTGPTSRWAPSPTSPTSPSARKPKPAWPPATDDRDPVTMIVTPIALTIQHTASHRGERVPARLRRASCWVRSTGRERQGVLPAATARTRPPACRPTEFVELPDKGTVTTFAIINIPFQGQRIKPPYVAAYVLLDGADIPFLHLVADIDAHEVRMGMRVEAVWKPREEWGFGIDNIEYFRPTGEPDADYDTYKHHL